MQDELAGIALVPLIVGLVEMAKRLGLRAAWAAPLAVALGLVVSLGWALTERGVAQAGSPGGAPPGDPQALARAALVGVALGLSASGLYSGAKHIAEQ